MRIALVHDYLTQYGGAERVLDVLKELYPDAPVYTSVVDLAEFLAAVGEVELERRPDCGALTLSFEPHPDPAPLQDLKRLAAAAAGVRSYRLSPHSLSVVVDYDRHRVPPALWHALIEGSDGAARTALETLCSPV